MLALTMPAEAKIVYTPASQTINVYGFYALDLNHDGIADFTIQLKTSHATGTDHFTTLGVLSPQNNAVEGGKTDTYGRGPYAFALRRGALIGPKRPFPGSLMAWAGTISDFSVFGGRWLNVKNRYLGLKFKIHGKTHYGWARLSVVSTRSSITSATLTGYAYETIPNKPIIAGRTKGPDDISVGGPDPAVTKPTAEPASLGALAMGASGLSIWRRKESSGAAW